MSDPVSVAREFFERMELGDGSALQTLSDDVIWTFPGSLFFSGRHEGKDAVVRDLLTASAPCFQPGHVKLDIHNLFADGGTVVAEYTGYNLTAAGGDYINNYVFMLEVEDGLIRTIRAYCDTDYMLRTLSA